MNFWKKVDEELKYLGKSRKELSIEADFDVSYIAKGIARNGVPVADLAVRIAKSLGTTVEYLLDMTEVISENVEQDGQVQNDILLLKKYKNTICNLDSLPDDKKIPIIEMIDKMKELENMKGKQSKQNIK